MIFHYQKHTVLNYLYSLRVNAKPDLLIVNMHFINSILAFLLVSAQAFDSHWLDDCANSTPVYLTIDQSYDFCLRLLRHQRQATHHQAIGVSFAFTYPKKFLFEVPLSN
jgi:hypothetical protein